MRHKGGAVFRFSDADARLAGSLGIGKPLAGEHFHGFARVLRRGNFVCGDRVGGEVATDRPPPNPTGPGEALNRPDCREWRDVPRGPLADFAVVHALGVQVRLNDVALLLAPAFFNFGVVVIWGVHFWLSLLRD